MKAKNHMIYIQEPTGNILRYYQRFPNLKEAVNAVDLLANEIAWRCVRLHY